jgi:hypothetical protein
MLFYLSAKMVKTLMKAQILFHAFHGFKAMLLKRVKRLQRELSPSKRVQIIEELLPELPPKAEPYTLEPDKMQTSHRNFNDSRRNIR